MCNLVGLDFVITISYLRVMPFICAGKNVYFVWSRITISKCLCKVDAFYLRWKNCDFCLN